MNNVIICCSCNGKEKYVNYLLCLLKSINVNTPEMKLKLNELLHNVPINKQYQKNYFIIALEKLLHLDYQDDRKEDITMYYQQLRDIIHILGCPIYNIDEKYSKFITSLDDEQVCFIGN